jgi:hypothetical protein
LGEIKKGVANNAPKAACPTCPLTTQHTIMQDVRALANGHCKSTKLFENQTSKYEKLDLDSDKTPKSCTFAP